MATDDVRYTGGAPSVGQQPLSSRYSGQSGATPQGSPPIPLDTRYTGAQTTPNPAPTPSADISARASLLDLNSLREFYAQQARQLQQTRADNMADIAARRSSALADMEARNKQLLEQANRASSQQMSVPVPIQAPINPATDVKVNPNLVGNNAASQAFYIAPQSTQSQFAVGAPVGGGFIGARHRGSSEDITSESNRLGGGKKDQF